ncbi:Phospholipase A1-IIdelta [Spatholobus suberectus]|nr:Phospholipase A1-IIdelta [Spatholobus suberectus]
MPTIKGFCIGVKIVEALILWCSDLIQATYDAFKNDPNSLYCCASHYRKASFFRKVMLDHPDHYDVSLFLYVTARVLSLRPSCSTPSQARLGIVSPTRSKWDLEIDGHALGEKIGVGGLNARQPSEVVLVAKEHVVVIGVNGASDVLLVNPLARKVMFCIVEGGKSRETEVIVTQET